MIPLSRPYIEHIIKALRGQVDKELIIKQLEKKVLKEKRIVQNQHAVLIPSLTNKYNNDDIQAMATDYLTKRTI